MAAAVSLPLRNVGARARRPRHGEVVRLRLAIADADDLRYVFNDWERDCGVTSSYEAQVNALIDRNFRRTLEAVDRHQQALAEGTIRLALAKSNFAQKIPLALRGWPRLTVRPGKPAVTITLRPGQKFAPEKWTLRWEGAERRSKGVDEAGRPLPPFRNRVIRAFRTLVKMHELDLDVSIAVLWRLYGPPAPPLLGSGAADELVFQFRWVAAIAHMTPAAIELAERATAQLRREIAERHAAELRARQSVDIQAERLAILDRAVRGPHDPMRIAPEAVPLFEARLAELDELERNGPVDIPAWTVERARRERARVEPREALVAALQKLPPAEQSALVREIRDGAERLVRRAASDYYLARGILEGEGR